MNYLDEIDRRIASARLFLSELEIARRVIEQIGAPATPKEKPALLLGRPKKKGGRKRTGVLKKSKAEILKILQDGSQRLSRDILVNLASRGLVVSDASAWKALKELRDEGLVHWDDTTRLYSLVASKKSEARAS